jgi:hypothetical protein
MTNGQQLESALTALADKIDLDWAACERLSLEIGSYAEAVEPDRPVIALVALDIERYYSSLESSFETIARVVDGAVPEGKDWHRNLLERMCRPGDTRPAVLSPESAGILRELLRFRHFLRHAYAVELDWAKLKPLAADLLAAHPLLATDTTSIKNFIKSCVAEVAEDG